MLWLPSPAANDPAGQLPDRAHPPSTRPLARQIQIDRPTAGPRPRATHEGLFIQTPFHVGRYLISPLTRPLEGGRFAAAVSIRSGAGSMTHDRVLRFVPLFDTHDQATRFAADQACAWLGEATPELHRTSTNQD